MTLSQLRDLEQKATPGPWFIPDRGSRHDFDQAWIAAVDWDGRSHLARADYRDAELIVALRNAAPLLLDVLDAARALARLGGTFVVDEHQFHEIRKASGRQLGVLRAALDRYESATLESGAP